MTLPGLATGTVATFATTIDAPGRFATSLSVGAYSA